MLILAILLFLAGVALPLIGTDMEVLYGCWLAGTIVLIIHYVTPKKSATGVSR